MSDDRKYFWEGNVGVKAELKTNTKTGERFPVFEPLRSYRVPDEEKPKYGHSFSREDMLRLAPLVNQAIAFADVEWVEETG